MIIRTKHPILEKRLYNYDFRTLLLNMNWSNSVLKEIYACVFVVSIKIERGYCFELAVTFASLTAKFFIKFSIFARSLVTFNKRKYTNKVYETNFLFCKPCLDAKHESLWLKTFECMTSISLFSKISEDKRKHDPLCNESLIKN